MAGLFARGPRRVDPGAVPSREAALTPALLEGSLRIGYVVWDWPALSQTFVLNEIRELQSQGHDVVVYYKVDADQPARLTFQVDAHEVRDADHLTGLLREHGRQVMHSPFAYPSATKLVWPAAKATGIPFTFMAGGVDVAHYENIKRNQVGEVASSPECLGVITLGTFHRDLLLECGVPSNRIVMERQSAALPAFGESGGNGERPLLATVGRFIEKKGFEYLVRAAAVMPDVDVRIHGYGPLEDDLRALAVELGASNVDFAGTIESSEALEQAYREADLFVLPCVRAENGDLDGLPTVLLEAMGAGVPIVTTDAANIPDLVIDGWTGFLCRQRDVDSLVDGVRRALAVPEMRRRALVRAARALAEAYASPRRTAETLLRLWRRESIDIVLVTYDTKQYRNEADTVAIIERVYQYTNLPFSLTVVDNDSDRGFVRRLDQRFGERENFRLIPLAHNVFCGPGSNIGFGQGSAPYLVYLCSNEGFVLRHGWDHQMVRALHRSGAAMGGQPVELAAHATGETIQDYPSFAKWRDQDFARENPERRFRHVQGGLFMIRRDVFESVGGFNDDVPQNGMDVEFSYVLESRGHALTTIPGVIGVSVKTRPAVPSLLDEFTVAVHPSSVGGVGLLDEVVARTVRLCPLCSWSGEAFDEVEGDHRCPKCRSTPFTRTAMRLLSASGQLQRRPSARVLVREPSGLKKPLSALSADLKVRVIAAEDASSALATAIEEAPALLVLDRLWPTASAFAAVRDALVARAASGTQVLVGVPADEDGAVDDLVRAAEAGGVRAHVTHLISGVCAFDPYPVVLLGFPYDDVDLQGIE